MFETTTIIPAIIGALALVFLVGYLIRMKTRKENIVDNVFMTPEKENVQDNSTDIFKNVDDSLPAQNNDVPSMPVEKIENGPAKSSKTQVKKTSTKKSSSKKPPQKKANTSVDKKNNQKKIVKKTVAKNNTKNAKKTNKD